LIIEQLLAKVGIRNLSPQLRNFADNQIDCGVADLKKSRDCDCGASKLDFRNFATLHSLLPIPLLSGTFSSAQDGFKNHQKCLYNCPFLWKKLVLKGQLHEIFYLRFFS
jgi:hypothetical protein